MKSVGGKSVVGDMVGLVSGMGRAHKDTHTGFLPNFPCNGISSICPKTFCGKWFAWLKLQKYICGLVLVRGRLCGALRAPEVKGRGA